MSPFLVRFTVVMLKQRFLKNSAKVIAVSTALLFISNVILWGVYEFPFIEEKLGLFAKLPNLSVYIFTLLTYLALNDEKAAHRKIKDMKSQKKVKVLKGFLIFVFASHFFVGKINKFFGGLNSVAADAFADAFCIVASFSFFLLLLSVWYFFRDKKEGTTNYAALISIAVTTVYVAFKFITARVPLILSAFSQSDVLIFTQRVQYSFCLLQYFVSIVMLLLTRRHYEKKECKAEEEEKKKEKPERPQVINLETEEGYGIDFIDDTIE